MIDRRGLLVGLAAAAASSGAHAGIIDWFNGARLGDPLPDHDGVFVQGEWLAERRLFLVDFWATWCAPCIAAIPHLNDLEQRFAPEGLQVIGVSDEPVAVVGPFVARRGIEYAVIAGGDRPLRRTMKIRALPWAVLVNTQRRIVWRGQPDDLDERSIREHLGSPPADG